MHRPLHIEIQKGLQAAENYSAGGKTYMGLTEYPAHTLRVMWYKTGNLAEVKTASKHKSTANNLREGRSVGAARNSRIKQRISIVWDNLSQSEKDWVVNDCGIEPERYVDILNKFYNRKGRKTI